MAPDRDSCELAVERIAHVPRTLAVRALQKSVDMSAAKTCVYIARSLADRRRYYTGVTSDPLRRLAAHNANRSPHTSNRGPWELDVVIEFTDEARALAFERYLKSGSGVAFSKRHLR